MFLVFDLDLREERPSEPFEWSRSDSPPPLRERDLEDFLRLLLYPSAWLRWLSLGEIIPPLSASPDGYFLEALLRLALLLPFE